jgi:hypothetical protein
MAVACSLIPRPHRLPNKLERFPVWASIQDTDGPSSDRLITEGRPLTRRLSFFYVHPIPHVKGGCLREHTNNMTVDSRQWFA